MILHVRVSSQDMIDRFEDIFDSFEPGIEMEIKGVRYEKQLKKEFQKRAKKLQNGRGIMFYEIDEMEQQDLEKMDIRLDRPGHETFGTSWYPLEHWYDWIPNYEDAEVQLLVPKHSVFSHGHELLRLFGMQAV